MADAHSSRDQAPVPPDAGERFVRLFAQNQKRLLGYIYSLVPHAQNAEDICQKTSLVLWRKFQQLQPDGDFLTWACRVAYLEVCSFRRTRARDRLRFSDELLEYLAEDRLGDLDATNQRLDALRECVKQLRPPQQELIQHAYSSEDSIRQLAERLGKASDWPRANCIWSRDWRWSDSTAVRPRFCPATCGWNSNREAACDCTTAA